MEEKNVDTHAEKIIALRKQRGLTQGEFAERIGVTRQAVIFWENDTAQPKLDKLMAICAEFGLDLDYFLSEEASDKEIVACDIAVTELEQTVEQVAEIQPSAQKKSLSRLKVAFGIMALVLLLSAISIVLCHFSTSPRQGFGEVSIVEFNFSAENISWIIFSVVLITMTIVGIIMIIKLKKRKR